MNNIQLNHESSVPLNDQAREGMTILRKHCLEFILEAQAERQVLVDKAKDKYQARIEQEEEQRRQKEEKDRLRAIEVSTMLCKLGIISCL